MMDGTLLMIFRELFKYTVMKDKEQCQKTCIIEKLEDTDFHQLKNSSLDQQIKYFQSAQITQKHAEALIISNENQMIIINMLQREKLIEVICGFLQKLFQSYGSLLTQFGQALIQPQCLLRLLNISMFGGVVNQCIEKIIISYNQNKRLVLIHKLWRYSAICQNTYIIDKICSYIQILKNRKFYKQVSRNQNASQFQYRIESNPSQSIVTNTDIIDDSFRGRKQRASGTLQSLSKEELEFYLSKMEPNIPWAMKIVAIQAILDHRQDVLKSSVLNLILKAFIPLLSVKRNNLALRTTELLQYIYGYLRIKPAKFDQLYWSNFERIVEHSLKYSTNNFDLINLGLQVSTKKGLEALVSYSLQCKIIKEKALVLNIILNKLKSLQDQYSQAEDELNNAHQRQSQYAYPRSILQTVTVERVNNYVKAMMLHIERSNHSEKPIALAALTIICILKEIYPKKVLSCLLRHSNSNLNKVIALSSEINPSLQVCILQYIKNIRYESYHKKTNLKVMESKVSGPLQNLLGEIVAGTAQLGQLGSLIFQNSRQLSVENYNAILELIQRLTDSEKLLEFQILIQETCKLREANLKQALLKALKKPEAYLAHLKTYIQLLEIFFNLDPQLNIAWARQLRDLYRTFSGKKSLQLRQKIVKMMLHFDDKALQSILSEKQCRLVKDYKKKMQRVLNDSQKLFKENNSQNLGLARRK